MSLLLSAPTNPVNISINVPSTVAVGALKQSNTAAAALPSVSILSQSPAVKSVITLLPSMLLSKPQSQLMADPSSNQKCGSDLNPPAVTKQDAASLPADSADQGINSGGVVSSVADSSLVKADVLGNMGPLKDCYVESEANIMDVKKSGGVKGETSATSSSEVKTKGDDDEDFKPSKKRFRQPASVARPVSYSKFKSCNTQSSVIHLASLCITFDVVQTAKKPKRGGKGIIYENDANMESGEEHPELAPDADDQPKWKMELNGPGGVAPRIGIPQSQIMDTGTYVCMCVSVYVCTYVRICVCVCIHM